MSRQGQNDVEGETAPPPAHRSNFTRTGCWILGISVVSGLIAGALVIGPGCGAFGGLVIGLVPFLIYAGIAEGPPGTKASQHAAQADNDWLEVRHVLLAALLGILFMTSALIISTCCSILSLGSLCGNTLRSEVSSPDGSRRAITFTRDCGAATAFSLARATQGHSPDSRDGWSETLHAPSWTLWVCFGIPLAALFFVVPPCCCSGNGP